MVSAPLSDISEHRNLIDRPQFPTTSITHTHNIKYTMSLLNVYDTIDLSEITLSGDDTLADKNVLEYVNDDHLLGIVHLHITECTPDRIRPWLVHENEWVGSGFVLEPNRIVTCAHCVEFATSIKVKKFGTASRFSADVIFFAPESDIAILRIESVNFMDGIRPLPVVLENDRLVISSPIFVFGYSEGNPHLQLRQGKVTGTSIGPNPATQNYIVGIDSSATVLCGNSGGPVLNSLGLVVGVLFCTNYPENATVEGASCFIPFNNTVRQVITDILRTARVVGVPDCGFEWQPWQFANLGVLVKEVYPWSPAFGKVYRGDTIWQINNRTISGEGGVENTIPKPGQSRDGLSEFVGGMFVGAPVTLAVSRTNEQGKIENVLVSYNLPNCKFRHLCPFDYASSRKFLIFGRYSFTPLSFLHFKHEGSDMQSKRLKKMASQLRTEGMEHEVVLMTDMQHILTDPEHQFVIRRVMEINFQRVLNFSHLVHLLDSTEGTYLFIKQGGDDIDDVSMYLTLDDERSRTETTVRTFHAPSDRGL